MNKLLQCSIVWWSLSRLVLGCTLFSSVKNGESKRFKFSIWFPSNLLFLSCIWTDAIYAHFQFKWYNWWTQNRSNWYLMVHDIDRNQFGYDFYDFGKYAVFAWNKINIVHFGSWWPCSFTAERNFRCHTAWNGYVRLLQTGWNCQKDQLFRWWSKSRVSYHKFWMVFVHWFVTEILFRLQKSEFISTIWKRIVKHGNGVQYWILCR